MRQAICELKQIRKDRLVENPLQPVGRTTKGALQNIKQSLATFGLVSPPSVAPIKGKKGYYMIADGQRRLSAFEGDSVTCLSYPDADPLDLFVVLNGVRKNIEGNAWMCSYAKAPDDVTRSRVLKMMPNSVQKWIDALEYILGKARVIELGIQGKQSPGIVNAVNTAIGLLETIEAGLSPKAVCEWMIRHRMQDRVNRLKKDQKDRVNERAIQALREAIERDERFDPASVQA
jgi:hypothetical protein